MSNPRRPAPPSRPGRPKTTTRKPAFDHEPTAVHSRRDQARLAAVGMHPRLVARASSEPITTLRPLKQRWPTFATGTPSTSPAEAAPPPRRRRRPAPPARAAAPATAAPATRRPAPPLAAPPRRMPAPVAAAPAPVAALPARARSRVPDAPSPVPARAPSVARPPRPAPPPSTEGTPLADIASLRPLPRPPSSPSLNTLESVPGDAPVAREERDVAAEPRRSGWLLAAIAGLCCVVAWTVGPLALGFALHDERATASALTAMLLAPLLAPMLLSAILRARGYRGWLAVTATLFMALFAVAAAWAVRLAGPMLLELGPHAIASDPWQAVAAVEAGVLRGLDALTMPHLLVVWGSELCLVLATVILCARRLRAADARA